LQYIGLEVVLRAFRVHLIASLSSRQL